MITTLPVVGNAVSGALRRTLYRRSKRVLTRLLGRMGEVEARDS